MLLPLKDQRSGRRRRSDSHSSVFPTSGKAARSSRVSLLSTVTAQSGGSNGSSSTITQESYNKFTKKRRSSTSKRKKEVDCSRRSTMEAVEETSLEGDAEADLAKDVDVFAFLVHEASGQTTNDNSSAVGGQDEPKPVPYRDNDDDDDATDERDLHSDSGISMNDASLVIGKATLQPLMPVPIEDHLDETSHLQWQYPRVPKPQYRPPNSQGVGQESSRGQDLPDTALENHQRRYPKSTPSVFTDDGVIALSTDHLAAMFASRDSPPLFKAFKKVNYRILLQLQDEIMELEEELARLDTYDGSRRVESDASTGDTLRRLSWRWGQCPFDLYEAKSEVLGRLQVRMDQYYKTIDLSEKMHRLQSVDISSAEVERFKGLLGTHFKQNGPASGQSDNFEAVRFKFLDDPDDILYPARYQVRHNNAARAPVEVTSLVPLIVPLFLFKIFDGVINRLLITSVTLAFSLHASCLPGMAKWIGMEHQERNQYRTQRTMLACAGISLSVGLLF